jgi:hypothetical protein
LFYTVEHRGSKAYGGGSAYTICNSGSTSYDNSLGSFFIDKTKEGFGSHKDVLNFGQVVQ